MDLPPEKGDDGERGFTRPANEWLRDPTDDNASRAGIAAEADRWDGGVRNHDYSDKFLAPAAKRAEDAAREMVRFASRLGASDILDFLLAVAREIAAGKR